MKICNKCGEERLEINFAFKNKVKGVRSTVCSECQKEYKKKHYYNNKEEHYKRNKKTEQKIKDYIDTIKKSGCSKCSEIDSVCMDFHHIDPTLKDRNVSEMYKYGSLNKVKLEIKKCILLCANCHRKEHRDIVQFVE